MKELKKLIKLIKYKYRLDSKRDDDRYLSYSYLLNEIILEIEEVKREIKKNNSIYLEDELGDILWGWLALVENLRNDKYITSHKSIFKRALKKYKERILPLKGDNRDDAIWKKVKKRQKKRLKKEKQLLKTSK